MIIEEINNLIKNIETINENVKPKVMPSGTVEGLKNIGKGVASIGHGSLQAWKPLSIAAGGAYLYGKGKEAQAEATPLINPTSVGLGIAGGAAGMHYLYKKNKENSQFSN